MSTTTKRTASLTVALLLAGAAGVALAQQGHGRSGAPPECVAGKHVIRSTPTAPRALRACRADADCFVAPVGCCGSCSSAPVTSYRAIATSRADAWRRHTCAPVVACPACAVPPPDADITPACVRGLCELTVHDAACTPPTGMGMGHS